MGQNQADISLASRARPGVQDSEQLRPIIALTAKREGVNGPELRVRPPILKRTRANARRLRAPEYSTASSSGKCKPRPVDCHCPNVSTDRDKTTADVGPIVSVVRRAKSSTGGARENL